MIKFCSSRVSRRIKNDGITFSLSIPRAFSFSSVDDKPYPKDVDSNKVDAPFVVTEPKVTRKLSNNDLGDASYHNNAKDDGTMTEEATNFVADKVNKGTKSAVETAFNVGEIMVEGMEQTFGTIRNTMQKVKHTLVDDSNVTSENKTKGHGKDHKHP